MPPLQTCHCCGLIQRVPPVRPQQRARCARCESPFPSYANRWRENQRVVALAAAALALFPPAILLPFLRIERLGHAAENSLLSGVFDLLAHGEWFVGLVLLVFSLIVPPAKLVLLVVLGLLAGRMPHRHRALTYRVVDQLGRWGMLDVMFVAVLVTIVKLGDLVEFVPRTGIVVFGIFVLLSLAASALWRPHHWWEEETMSEATSSEARVEPVRRMSWWWLLPLVALAASGALLARNWREQGPLVRIAFADGHGIKVGDALRHRGIVVGVVEDVLLADGLNGVELNVRLQSDARRLARAGTRFWIVRPRIDLAGVEGLETMLGSKYLAALPGPEDAPSASRFVGLEEPPLVDLMQPGGLSLVLNARNLGGLHAGLPLLYRDVRIGGITRVGLASDGGLAEVHIYVLPRYRHLVRENARFWNSSGIQWQGGLTGFTLRIGTAEMLLRGGIALAIPPDAGPPAAEGARFLLLDEPPAEWLLWTPVLSQGDLPANLPHLRYGQLTWKSSLLGFTRTHTRAGWILPVEGAWLGPADLLAPAEAAARAEPLRLTDEVVSLAAEPAPPGMEVVWLPRAEGEPGWPLVRIRRATVPEDSLLVTEPGTPPRFVAAARYQQQPDGWHIDPGLNLNAAWHGAAVVAQQDGALIGMVIYRNRTARLVPVPVTPQ